MNDFLQFPSEFNKSITVQLFQQVYTSRGLGVFCKFIFLVCLVVQRNPAQKETVINGVITVSLSLTVWHNRLALASETAAGNAALLFSPTHFENVTSRASNGAKSTRYKTFSNQRVERCHCDRALRNHQEMNDQYRDSRHEALSGKSV